MCDKSGNRKYSHPQKCHTYVCTHIHIQFTTILEILYGIFTDKYVCM